MLFNLSIPGFSTSLQRDLFVISFLYPTLPVCESFEGKGVFLAGVIRKLLIHGLLLVINIINFVTEAVWKGTQACYICGFGRGCSSSLLSPVQQHLLSSLSESCCNRGECAMEGQGENVCDILGKKLVSVEGSRGVTDAAAGMGSPSATAQAGSSLHLAMHNQLGTKMSGSRPLVLDMEAARKAISGFLVVGRLLSPFQGNPRVILDDLRNMVWKNQGATILQEVASDDGRFILNFAAENDRRFVLKEQPWHFKRDGLVFAEFDGKGDPTKVDLGVMTIWVQVRDLPFMLKTKSIGWSLEDQLGEVLEVSHRNHVIVEKYLRVRVKLLLHEPPKTSVGFTPLGSSKILKFDVKYEKLPLYCEFCGIMGHTSERFCKIPSEKRVACFPRNLSVEPY